MQSSLLDSKLQTLHDLYKDNHLAKNAQKDVEQIRRKALLVGVSTSASMFVLNEAVRLTSRSRIL